MSKVKYIRARTANVDTDSRMNDLLGPSSPAADSTNTPEVVVPNIGAGVVASASTSMVFPFLSRNPARAKSPIKVPMVSTKAVMKIVSTTGKAPQLRARTYPSAKNGCYGRRHTEERMRRRGYSRCIGDECGDRDSDQDCSLD